MREPPRSRADYLAAEHITVVYEPRRALDLDQQLAAQGMQRRFAVMVPGFAGLPPFMRGSDLLATVPGLLQSHLLRGLASVRAARALPAPCRCTWSGTRATSTTRRTAGCGASWRRWWGKWWCDSLTTAAGRGTRKDAPQAPGFHCTDNHGLQLQPELRNAP